MKKIILLLFWLCASSGFAQSSPPVSDTQAMAGLDTLRQGLIDSFNHQNVDQLLTYLDPNVVVVWQNGEISHGPAEVKAYSERMMKGENAVVKSVQVAPEILGRQINGDWAVSWGNLHDHLVLNDGRDLPLNSVFTATTAKRGDHWVVVDYHASINAFDNPILGIAEHQSMLWAGGIALAIGLIIGAMTGLVLHKKRSGGG